MKQTLTALSLVDGPVPLVVLSLAALCLVLLVLRPTPRGARGRWILILLGSAVVGAIVGLLTCWLVGDVVNAFDVTLSAVTRAWVAAAFAGVAIAIANLVMGRGVLRRVGAGLAIVPLLAAGAFGVNADFGQYTTIRSVLGESGYSPLPVAAEQTQRNLVDAAATSLADWRPATALPQHGVVGSVDIPGTQSHFPARPALVYLPPAALVRNAPVLPVVVMLPGQPGSPADLFQAGNLKKILDSIAAANNGLTPIVVAPDQLSADSVNPMCVDSVLGNSATYLTVDVPQWIRTHLGVDPSAAGWAIAGFSQGGTCAIQLGAGHPEVFGSLMDISGELEPKVGDPAQTIAAGFAGDAAAYDAAKPLNILTKNAPYPNGFAVFGVGGEDEKYGPWVRTVMAAAAAAGMTTSYVESPGTAHAWSTARYVLANGLPILFAHLGVPSAPAAQ